MDKILISSVDADGAKSGGIGRVFNSLGIRAKVLMGFGTVMLMLAVVAGAGYTGLVGISNDVTKLTEAVDEANLANSVEVKFLKMQAHVTEYANLQHQKDAAAVQKYAVAIQADIDKVLNVITKEDHLAKAREMAAAFDAYMTQFNNMRSLASEAERQEIFSKVLAQKAEIIIKDAEWLAAAADKEEHFLLDDTQSIVITTELTMLIISLVGLALGTIVALVMGRMISRPVADMTGAMARIAEGDTDVAIPGSDRGDEIGSMAHSLVDLRDAVKKAFELGQLGQMVDDMPINVMMCDAKDFKITYMNNSTMSTLKGLEHLLPAKADELVGQCIDIFHKNPEHQRRLLADPGNLPHTANIKVGDELLSLKVNAVRDKAGNYIGPMLTWSVITEQVKLSEKVMNVVKNVSAASTEMRSTAEGMSATAEETSRQSTAVAAAAEQATANVQTVASAAEEMSASIGEINRQVGQSSEIANRANAEAGRTNETVQGLADAASKIGEVVNLISDIAEQTNLLALNATIEAARAGEAGKGFAVVASEVKNLATQTAKATEEIAAQVTDMQSVTGDAVDAIKNIADTIGEINSIADTISTAVTEQGSATQEIAENTQQAASGTQEVSSNITGVTQAASETGSSAQEVLGAADELSKQAEALSSEVEAFLNQVKAA
ncbi:MAG: methyl-accepting chemotaxis protein [Alphaproteobacteria bacterium]|nr:methyl-accepting chemotaxis protein [Alphaproteobacteria bacterium]